MKKSISARQLRELLRSADPLTGDDGLREADVARLRRAVLAEVRPRPASWRLAPALAAAVLLLLALHAGFTVFEETNHVVDSTELTAARDTVPAAPAPEPGRRQQVQFVTANGTRVIWVLSSDLSL